MNQRIPAAVALPGDPSLTFPLPQAPRRHLAGSRTRRVLAADAAAVALDHINLWVLRDGASWTLVDTGLNSETTRGLWDQIVTSNLGASRFDVVVTHYHPVFRQPVG
jgi:glyoxylase-like metal-dependent hydrolase (beta-lactamase superfamily II)